MDILVGIYVNTNFDDPVTTNKIIQKAGLIRDPIFESVKELLKAKKVFNVKKVGGNLELIKINYILLGDLIEMSDSYYKISKFIKIRKKVNV